MRWAGPLFFLTLAWVPLLNRSRFGDLSNWYTDHLHHSFATWVSFSRGLEIYTRPFGEIRDGTGWPYPVEAWGNMPGFAYPPGVVGVFLPLTLLGRFGGLSFHAFAVVSVLVMLALAAWAFHRALQALVLLPRGSRAATLVLTWLLLSQMGLQGFFDSAFVGAGFAGLEAWRRRKPDVALLWLALAAFLHYRAVVFAPLGVWVLLRCWRERASLRSLLPKLALAGGLITLSFVSFLLMYPTTRAFQAQATTIVSVPNAVGLVLAASLGLAALLGWRREWMALAALGLVVALALVEPQNFWWHGVIILTVPYFIGALRDVEREAEVSMLRGASLLWAFALHPLVWRDHPGQVFVEFVKFFKPG